MKIQVSRLALIAAGGLACAGGALSPVDARPEPKGVQGTGASAATQPWRAAAGAQAARPAHGLSRSARPGSCQGPLLGDEDFGTVIASAFGPDETVPISLLASETCSPAVAERVKRLGGSIYYSDTKIGYFVAYVPRSKVLDFVQGGGIDYISARSYVPTKAPEQIRDRLPEPERIVLPQLRVDTVLGPHSPYFAAEEGGLGELRRRHPTADGRGITIAYPDGGIDITHPTMRYARAADGTIIPKVADIDPIGHNDYQWVQFGAPVRSSNRRIAALGRDWRLPADGSYRIAAFRQRIGLAYGEFNPSGTAKDRFVSAGLLWSDDGPTVRVDTDGDGDFGNNPPLHDYALRQEIDWFGHQVDEDDNRIPFGIKIDAARKRAWISAHGVSHDIEGVLAANTLAGGLFDGAAPSAQLIDMRDELFNALDWAYAQVASFARPDADIVHRSGGPGLDQVPTNAISRATAAYDKPYVSGMNIPGSLRIGIYVAPEVLQRNVMAPPPYLPMTEVVSIGEDDYTQDGTISGVLAPGCNIQLTSRYSSRSSMPEQRLGFPAGYIVDCSPSGTIPYGTGVLASLMSEARARGVRYNTERLINAVETSARPLPGLPVERQYRGVIDAIGAWQQLERMAAVDGPGATLTSFHVAREIDGTRRPVNGYLADWTKAGTAIDDTLWLSRTGGRAGPQPYRLSMWMNDGTYTLLQDRVMLDRDRAVPVRFRASVGPGRHIAFLRLADEASGTVMQDIALHTRAPNMPTSATAGVEHYRSTIPPLTTQTLYLASNDGTQAARYVMQLPATGAARLRTMQMPGLYGSGGLLTASFAAPGAEAVDPAHHVGPIETFRSLAPNDASQPQRVVWSNGGYHYLANERDGPAADVPVEGRLSVERYAVALAPKGAEAVSVTNRMARVEGRVEYYDASVSEKLQASSGPHHLVRLPRLIAAGTEQWRIAIQAPQGNDAVAYLLKCERQEEGCRVSSHEVRIKHGTGMLVVDNPQEGHWMLAVRTDASAAYTIREALLTSPQRSDAIVLAAGETRDMARPADAGNARYAAFRIPRRADESGPDAGVRIAMTALQPNLP